MLTRNKKKRTVGMDESYLQNPNQVHSTFPGNNAVEVGEMVTMDHGATSGGRCYGCHRMDYLQMAWLLREKLNDLVDGEKGKFPELGLQSLLDIAASCNIVSVDPKVLNPILWRTLPKELLLLVFARLSVFDITRLRCLSRAWRKDMATTNSEINQACDEASPSMVALLSHSSTNAFLVTIYDFTKCSWQYAYNLHLQSPLNDDSEYRDSWTAMDACDGGLVCFMSLWKPTKDKGLCIVVVNLLTRVQHELPPMHGQYYTLPAMVQIKVDLDTKCYKIVVVVYEKRRRTVPVEIYDSSSRQWITVVSDSGSIFGPLHYWASVSGWCRKTSTQPGIYDFAKGKLELYNESNPYTLHGMGSEVDSRLLHWVLQKDRLFILLVRMQMDASHEEKVHCIKEYHFKNEKKAWVQETTYECPSFEELLRNPSTVSARSLSACDGFLMVTMHHSERSQYFWLLDLSTNEWSKLPKISKGKHTKGSLLCMLSWNVIP